MHKHGIVEVEVMDRALVLQRVADGVMTQAEAAKSIGVSARQVRRLLRRYQANGADGLRRQKTVSMRKISDKVRQECIELVAVHYADFGPTLAAEMLSRYHGVSISRETLRKWLIFSNLWKFKVRKKPRIHQSRERRPRFGELVQIDGSHHDWFEGRGQKCCLLVAVDDATSSLVGLRFEAAETTAGYMRLITEHLKNHGKPIAYYSDKHSIFRTTRIADNVGMHQCTQLHRALNSLKIELICAHSPQAKGRVERANKTLQDRLIKAMRLAKISDVATANAWLPWFINEYNQLFAKEAASPIDAHRPVPADVDVSLILCPHHTRTVNKNLEFSFNGLIYKLYPSGSGHRLRHANVAIYERLDGQIIVSYQEKFINYSTICKTLAPLLTDDKTINTVVDALAVRVGKEHLYSYG